MSTVNTRTQTYTVADIRKVVESFAAVYSMIAQSTKLHQRDFVARKRLGRRMGMMSKEEFAQLRQQLLRLI